MGTEYRSLLGKLSYFQTKIAPILANATRELSSHASNPNKDHWHSMGRLVGFIRQEDIVFTLRSPEEMRGIDMCDANYAQCQDSRRSVGGGLQTVLEEPYWDGVQRSSLSLLFHLAKASSSSTPILHRMRNFCSNLWRNCLEKLFQQSCLRTMPVASFL